MKRIQKALSLLLSFVMLLGLLVSASVTSASAATHLACVKQNDPIWKDHYYNEGNLYDTGCGVFSLVNAVGYLTGLRMSVTDVASWAYSIGAFNVTDSEGTYRTTLYPQVEKKYGETYGFSVDCDTASTGYWEGASSTTLKSHLENGGVAVGHVPGHFIAVVGYDSDENNFHVYDSYATNGRGTTSNGGDVWVTQSQFSTGQLALDWFCLLTATDDPGLGLPIEKSVGIYATDAELSLYSAASDTSDILATIPFNTLVTVAQVSDGWGHITYNNKSGYISLSYATRVGDLPISKLYPVGMYETISDLNMRAAPSADGALVTTIPKGTTIFVTSIANSNWGYTSYTGFDGYVNLKYATRTGSLPASADCTVGIYTNTTDINMRSASAYESDVVTVIPANTTFTVTKVSSGWGYTEYKDYAGWVNLAYVTYVGPLSDPTDIIIGDVNGDGITTIADATEIQRFLAELTDFDDEQMRAADANGDGAISISDATQIQRFLAHLIGSLG